MLLLTGVQRWPSGEVEELFEQCVGLTDDAPRPAGAAWTHGSRVAVLLLLELLAGPGLSLREQLRIQLVGAVVWGPAAGW